MDESLKKRAEELVQEIQKAVQDRDFQKAFRLNGELITVSERLGQIDETTSRRLRMDLATAMIRAMQYEPIKEKVTLSLPQEILRALRIAAGEAGKEMSTIVTEALQVELQKYTLASSALRKSQ